MAGNEDIPSWAAFKKGTNPGRPRSHHHGHCQRIGRGGSHRDHRLPGANYNRRIPGRPARTLPPDGDSEEVRHQLVGGRLYRGCGRANSAVELSRAVVGNVWLTAREDEFNFDGDPPVWSGEFGDDSHGGSVGKYFYGLPTGKGLAHGVNFTVGWSWRNLDRDSKPLRVAADRLVPPSQYGNLLVLDVDDVVLGEGHLVTERQVV